jgi:hypothetical protein
VADGEGRRTVAPDELRPTEEESCTVELTLLRALASDVPADPLSSASARVERAGVRSMVLDP